MNANQLEDAKRNVVETVCSLFDMLLEQPNLLRGEKWEGEWPGWDFPKWQAGRKSVYVLWENESDLANNLRPVYVGEGDTGRRIHASFHARETWSFAQILYHDLIDEDKNGRWMRKLLERFAICTLQPKDNSD